jgi:hypothetical protein
MVPKDQPFPKYAHDYFEQLRQQYQLLLEETGQQPKPTVAELIAKAQQSPDAVTWADVFTLETAYLYALADSGDLDRLRAEVLYARTRLRDVIGADEYAAYAQTVIADVSKLSVSELRAELMTLAERLRYVYTFVPPKEAVRNKMAIDAAWWTLSAVVFGIAMYGFIELGLHWTMVTILVVGFVGQMGGFLSVQQRLQSSGGDDPLYKELLLTNGWFSVVVIAPLSGAVFAIVLYFVFVGGLMTGGLFPRFGSQPPPQPKTISMPMDVTQFLVNSTPSAMEDWGKLLVWAFVAGFAERFVPDVLTRLTGQSSGAGAKPVSPGTVSSAQGGGDRGGGGRGGADQPEDSRDGRETDEPPLEETTRNKDGP